MALRIASLAVLTLIAAASAAEHAGSFPDTDFLPEALLADDACPDGDQDRCSLALMQRSGLRARVPATDQARAEAALADVAELDAEAKPLEAEDQDSVPADGFIFALESASGKLACLVRYLPMGNEEDAIFLSSNCNGKGAGEPARFRWRTHKQGSGKLEVVSDDPSYSGTLCLTYSSDLSSDFGLFYAECQVAQWWAPSKGVLQTTGNKCLRTKDGRFKLEDCVKKASEPQHFYALQTSDMKCVELSCSKYCSYECRAVRGGR